MPRPAKSQERVIADQTLVVDNGGYTMKAGFAGNSSATDGCQVIPNCIAKDRGKRIWIGSQLEKCKDFGEIAFRRPIEKGVLVNWEAEKAIWDNTFIENGAPLKVRTAVFMEALNLQVIVRSSHHELDTYGITEHACCFTGKL